MPTANYLIANSLALKVNKFEHVQRGLEPCREGKARDLYRVGIRAKALYGGSYGFVHGGRTGALYRDPSL